MLPDVNAAMNALLRHCFRVRDGLTADTHPSLPHLNVLIAMTGGYFGQDPEIRAIVGDVQELM